MVVEWVGLVVDTTGQLNVYLDDREMRARLGLACSVCINFLPGVAQKWDFWAVPLAMHDILGTL